MRTRNDTGTVTEAISYAGNQISAGFSVLTDNHWRRQSELKLNYPFCF